ncbi:MAG: nitrogen regulation protein NR(II) [Gammaproteobacteria bacterium]|nr:nitrogen regulation protein NR(II) [Gammaproteobacteria bacterium]
MKAPEPTQRILDNLTTAVMLFDAALTLTAINPAGEMLLEVSAKRILGQRVNDLLVSGEQLLQALQEALATRHSITARGVVVDLPGQRTLTLDCAITPLVDGHAEPSALLVEMNQVDRLLRLAREENLLDQQSANRVVMRGLAHEIKNPLGGLRGAAQLLERELTDKGLKEYTRIIIHEADRLRNLVDRMMGPHQLPQKNLINMHAILEHVRLLIRVEVPELTIVRDYDPSLPDVIADREQLIQAVLNIVRNSVQALDGQGTVILRTRIERGFTLGPRRHRLVLRADIEDDGPGIPPELLEYIFYPMVTGRAGGTGLGLSIAQDIITKHGGLIQCQTRPGRTAFTVYLPLENDNG